MKNGALKEDKEYVNPSLGVIGSMYFDEFNNRIKYFCSDIHSNFSKIGKEIDDALTMMGDFSATRINARFFYSGSGSTEIPNLEARIPLTGDYRGIDLLFIGINEKSRFSAEEIILEEQSLLGKLGETENKDKKINPYFKIEKLNQEQLTNDNINDMLDLYAEAFETYTTAFSKDSIADMVENSIVYAAKTSEGKIVSTAVAEIGEIATEKGMFSICELSEVASRRNSRGNGLAYHVVKSLVDEIEGEIDLIYTEARASHFPINKIFSKIGFSFAGMLNKQCVLSGDREVEEKGPYENLNVWYLNNK